MSCRVCFSHLRPDSVLWLGAAVHLLLLLGCSMNFSLIDRIHSSCSVSSRCKTVKLDVSTCACGTHDTAQYQSSVHGCNLRDILCNCCIPSAIGYRPAGHWVVRSYSSQLYTCCNVCTAVYTAVQNTRRGLGAFVCIVSRLVSVIPHVMT